MDETELDRRFTYHAPSPDKQETMAALRDEFRALAGRIAAVTPPGREQSEAITCLETAQFFANAAIVRPMHRQ